jgi:hypothetical protein
MWIDPDARTSSDGKRMIKILNLQPTPLKRIWTFAPSRVVEGTDFENVPDDPRPEIKMRMRSFYSVLNLLAYGINVPPKDEEEGRAFTKASYDQAVREGRAVDLSDKFVVHSSSGKRPANAFVAVKHRGTGSTWTIVITSPSASSMRSTTSSIWRSPPRVAAGGQS